MTPNFSKVPIGQKGAADARRKTATEIVDQAREALTNLGLEEYPKPSSTPRPLAEIDEADSLTNTELGILYAQYIAYAQYVGAKLAEVTVMYKIATGALKTLSAELSTQLASKNVPKSEIGAQVRASVAFQEGEDEVLKFYALKAMIEAVHRAYDKQAAAISRIISLRELEFNSTIRGENLNKSSRRQAIRHDLRK
jgi:hypothetical protein